MRLVLFDIDGTLLWSHGAGRRSMNAALTELIGTSGPAEYRYDGKTDPQIARDIMTHAGHVDEEIDRLIPRLLERYVVLLADELREQRLELFAGVATLLDAVDAADDLTLGLLTGNVRVGAELKLRAAGLRFERFRVGAYGSDHEERPQLPAIAQRRARETLGLDFAGGEVIVIGDTPADIACGRGIGARTIAVATGHYRADELVRHAPAAVFDTLEDTGALLSVIRHV
jgi:phosphoglycolate phosphatase